MFFEGKGMTCAHRFISVCFQSIFNQLHRDVSHFLISNTTSTATEAIAQQRTIMNRSVDTFVALTPKQTVTVPAHATVRAVIETVSSANNLTKLPCVCVWVCVRSSVGVERCFFVCDATHHKLTYVLLLY